MVLSLSLRVLFVCSKRRANPGYNKSSMEVTQIIVDNGFG